MIPFRHKFRAMASVAEIQLYAQDLSSATRGARAAQHEVERIESKYSRYRDDSVTTAINCSGGGDPVRVDAETAALLDYAHACWEQSDGLFDITSGVLRGAWDFRRGVPPAQSDIEPLLDRIGWSRVHRDGGSIALALGMEIDFGGIGKEYAADRAAAVLLECGISSALVNLGGDIRALGSHPGGKPWRIGIVDPRAPDRSIAHVQVDDGALATSGDYQRCMVHDGRRYCHVLTPKTGWPVEGPQSVSVIAPLCVVAGSCATIAMLKCDSAKSYLDEQQLPYLLIDRDGVASGTLSGTN